VLRINSIALNGDPVDGGMATFGRRVGRGVVGNHADLRTRMETRLATRRGVAALKAGVVVTDPCA